MRKPYVDVDGGHIQGSILGAHLAAELSEGEVPSSALDMRKRRISVVPLIAVV